MTIEQIGEVLANDAISQGLTLDHLSAGWDLMSGDMEYAEEIMGRELTTQEKTSLKTTFEYQIKREIN